MQAPIHPIEQLHWQVSNACSQQPFCVDEMQQSYLAHMLMRYLQQENLSLISHAECEDLTTFTQRELRIIGDECLLLSGFCPHRTRAQNSGEAATANVADFGQRCYARLAALQGHCELALYQQLAENYSQLVTVLQTMAFRRNAQKSTLLEQAEHWLERNDYAAYASLVEIRGGEVCLPADKRGLGNIH